MTLNLIDFAPSRPKPAHEKAPPKDGDFPRNGKDQPMVYLPEGGAPVALTRTTTFIDTIEDKSTIADWKARCVLVGAAKSAWLLDAVRELSLDNPSHRIKLNALAERAMKEAGAHDKREQGTHLHGLSELIDKRLPLPEGLPEADLMDMAEYAMATMGMRFSHIEQGVVVPELKVGGTPDRIMSFDPEWPLDDVVFPEGASIEDDFIFDLKTGRVDYGGLKMASQLAVYSRGQLYYPERCPAPPYAPQCKKADDGWDAYKAWRAWTKAEITAEEAAKLYEPIPPVNQKWGVILNLPSGSGEATLHWANLEIGWEAANLSTVIRATRRLKGQALVDFSKVATAEPAPAA